LAFGSRIRNGLAKLLSDEPVPLRHHTNSVDLNQLKKTINSSLLSEMVPGGLSQPVWGPEISTVGGYSREGYTSRTFDQPEVPFKIQAYALGRDEDVQLAINDLSSKVTGGEHYVKGRNEGFIEHMEKFTKDFHFDTFDTELVKELLWYGNSVWKPRMGIRNVNRFSDLMHIPISSFVRIWWDRQRVPYKYEFRGAEYQGYHNPGEIMHFKWNPVNASVFGTGFGVSLTSTREFTMVLANEGEVDVRLPSMLDRKYSTQFTMSMAEQRYVSRNVWIADGATADQRASLQSSVENAQIGQDVVSGVNVDVKELGSSARNFNPSQFADITQGPIFKALNDFRGKQAGESTHTFANAERAALLDELGLTAFPISIREQLAEKLFEPWYAAHPFYDKEYNGGILSLPWDKTYFELNFGRVDKKDITVEDMTKLIELGVNTGAIRDPKQIIKLLEKAGLPVDENDLVTFGNMLDDPDGKQALNNVGAEKSQELKPTADIGGGPIFNDQVMGSPPMDDPIYDNMMNDVRGSSKTIPTNYRRSNQSQDWNTGRSYE